MNNPASPEPESGPAHQLVHDLNNQLLVISCSGSQLLSRLSAEDSNRELVLAILQASSQAADLVRQIQPCGKDSTPIDGTVESSRCDPASRTILLVEDDAQVRQLVKSQLSSVGFEVLEARHGPAAISAAVKHSRRIDLLITDVQLPEMSGDEIASTLRKEAPGLPVIFISGLAQASEVRGDSADYFLQKPFKLSDLLAMVRQILGVSRAP